MTTFRFKTNSKQQAGIVLSAIKKTLLILVCVQFMQCMVTNFSRLKICDCQM